MPETTDAWLTEWHRIVAEKDIDVLIRPANEVDALREVVAPQIGAFLASVNSKDDA